jgi:hypothetical protein
LYFHFFSDSFCITFLYDGIATFISKQILSFIIIIIIIITIIIMVEVKSKVVPGMKMTVFWDRLDDGGSKNLLNVGQFLRDYTEQHPRQEPFSY